MMCADGSEGDVMLARDARIGRCQGNLSPEGCALSLCQKLLSGYGKILLNGRSPRPTTDQLRNRFVKSNSWTNGCTWKTAEVL